MLPLDFAKNKPKDKRKTARRALELVGIKEQADKHCNKLSGGQKQRAAIARAISQRSVCNTCGRAYGRT
jgi:putative ABC transport system ATP-binding protein